MLNLELSHIDALLRNDEQKQFRGTIFLLMSIYFSALILNFLIIYSPHISNKAPKEQHLYLYHELAPGT